MRFIILAAVALVAFASAVPVENIESEAKILRSELDQEPEGGYAFNYETENGIRRDEQGKTKTVIDADNKPQTIVEVRGSYSFITPDGIPVNINYEADEEGYRATGDSIPVAPSRR